ncbi:hypothetical protein FIBSPDRAFT_891419 [Athelia psychrophila]|uniref:Uncharacterized protein n=1 Tax=Athelia psychrophila TaxID=1759441 RepID=A0A166JMR0_9AGAM|nr:hypothetical protein FIBSPDRAFT_891419 [Fibularhizoctonia sp. CBS 109695]
MKIHQASYYCSHDTSSNLNNPSEPQTPRRSGIVGDRNHPKPSTFFVTKSPSLLAGVVAPKATASAAKTLTLLAGVVAPKATASAAKTLTLLAGVMPPKASASAAKTLTLLAGVVPPKASASAAKSPALLAGGRATESDGVRSEEIIDENGDVHVHVTMPAALAQHVEWSFQMTPRRPPSTRSPVPSPSTGPRARGPMRHAQYELQRPAGLLVYRSAPPSPPSSPSPSPSPTPRASRVPRVPPPRGAELADYLQPIYPRAPGTWHALDPVPEDPTHLQRFYVVTKGTKIGVFWAKWRDVEQFSRAVNGFVRKGDSLTEALDLWDNTPANEKQCYSS